MVLLIGDYVKFNFTGSDSEKLNFEFPIVVERTPLAGIVLACLLCLLCGDSMIHISRQFFPVEK